MKKAQAEKTGGFNKKKTELRKQILRSRNALSPEQRKVWDRQILNRLIQYDKENPSPVYLCYVNYRSEVSTKEFILWCLQNRKLVFVPKVISYKAEKSEENDAEHSFKAAEMEFFQITAWNELKAGYQGILEPEAIQENSFGEWMKKTESASNKAENPYFRMLLPGAVFDAGGNRIGYGGGFYDRWLARWNQAENKNRNFLEKIGLAYRIQMVDKIPAENFDQRVDRVFIEDDG